MRIARSQQEDGESLEVLMVENRAHEGFADALCAEFGHDEHVGQVSEHRPVAIKQIEFAIDRSMTSRGRPTAQYDAWSIRSISATSSSERSVEMITSHIIHRILHRTYTDREARLHRPRSLLAPI